MEPLSRLIDALRCLPGVGPKSAQRMAFHLLKHQRTRGLHLAACLTEAMTHLNHCTRCNHYTTETLCSLCQNKNRDFSMLCIVENPADLAAIEQCRLYQGSYFILMNKISPIDGIGPEDIGLEQLEHLVQQENTKEIILALTPTIEGQTTIHFIQDALKAYPIKISQLAQGIPAFGDLEYLDGQTLSQAFRHRHLVTHFDDATREQ